MWQVASTREVSSDHQYLHQTTIIKPSQPFNSSISISHLSTVRRIKWASTNRNRTYLFPISNSNSKCNTIIFNINAVLQVHLNRSNRWMTIILQGIKMRQARWVNRSLEEEVIRLQNRPGAWHYCTKAAWSDRALPSLIGSSSRPPSVLNRLTRMTHTTTLSWSTVRIRWASPRWISRKTSSIIRRGRRAVRLKSFSSTIWGQQWSTMCQERAVVRA